jgi:heat shock protein HtpX
VTRGLLDALDRDELQGVVAHEMSHIRNLDVRVMTIVAALVGAVALLADWARRSMMWGGGRRRDRDKNGSGAAGIIFFAIWLLAILLAPLLAQLLAMMVSRRREYLADASGAELTRNPLGLASALEKIDAAAGPTVTVNRGTAHLCIADPLGRSVNLKEGGWANLFASHPPMAARIAALKEMAYQRSPR